jgi:hypothetical protein
MRRYQVFPHPAAVVLVLGLAASGHAETIQCTAIASLPTTIISQGIYCLTSDFSTNLSSGAAITINANNVILDLNGHKIGNLSAGIATTADGIYAEDRQNITIKNGTIRGFFAAITLNSFTSTSQGHLIEGIRADQSTYSGINVSGNGCLVRGNQVVATGGTTTITATTMGISIYGTGSRVIDNDVITVTPTAGGVSSDGMMISGTDCMVINNRVTDASTGIYMLYSSTKFRDNMTTNITATPYSGGTDAGNNH